jgi:hypothetical protein
VGSRSISAFCWDVAFEFEKYTPRIGYGYRRECFDRFFFCYDSLWYNHIFSQRKEYLELCFTFGCPRPFIYLFHLPETKH